MVTLVFLFFFLHVVAENFAGVSVMLMHLVIDLVLVSFLAVSQLHKPMLCYFLYLNRISLLYQVEPSHVVRLFPAHEQYGADVGGAVRLIVCRISMWSGSGYEVDIVNLDCTIYHVI